MIQDFSNVFVGKQSVRVKPVEIRGNAMIQKAIGSVVVGGLAAAIVLSLSCGLLIRAGLRELADQNAAKAELIKEQHGLQGQRAALLDQDTLTKAAGKLGLYSPEDSQVRHL